MTYAMGLPLLVRRAAGTFRKGTAFPCEGGALPAGVPGVGWSDHRAYWAEGYEGLVVTDTAPFRNPHYHGPSDRAGMLDYERLARVTMGLRDVVEGLARGQPLGDR
jgi:hypothetical protein